ncbi:MAG: TldD/PmbA family protein [Pseudomonadota bacterium]
MSETDTDLAARLIDAAKAAGAEAADALVISETALQVGVRAGVLEEAEREESTGLGLRVLIGQRQACVASSTAAAIDEMAARAVAIAREAPDDAFCGLLEPGQVTAADLDLDLQDTAPAPDPAMLEAMALEAEAAALEITGITQVEQASAGYGQTRVTMAATNGFAGSYGRTSTGLSVSAIAGEGLGRERDYRGESRRYRADLPSAREIGLSAGERAIERLAPRKPPSGAYPVLYDVRVAPGLIRHVLGAINGSAVARGASWLREAMGAEILPRGLDLIEDPLIRRGPASRPFDAEGVAGAASALVEDGVLARWILDAATARKLGLTTTGNARRGTTAPPSPGTTNVRLTPGSRSRAELIAEMGTGLIVTSMIGASINATTGAYSRGASGFWVEGGEIAYPVNEITVAGSLPQIMRRIVPANDPDPAVSVSVPSLLVEGLTIGA